METASALLARVAQITGFSQVFSKRGTAALLASYFPLGVPNIRFVVVQVPTDTWAVFDTIVDVPADFANQCLIGLTRDGAEWFAARCNQQMSRSVGRVQDTPRRVVPLMPRGVNETIRRQAT